MDETRDEEAGASGGGNGVDDNKENVGGEETERPGVMRSQSHYTMPVTSG